MLLHMQISLLKAFHTKSIVYYIYTNEIPSELSRKNMISSHVKITLFSHVKSSLLLCLHRKIAPFDMECQNGQVNAN